ncbi:8883_t:CDS:2 [Entrophospora sp. SA101]|nr:9768_t:CDS:2 [Entrophospora sp. SA101]CAJ0826718.1 8883_t:CDS:2 [Entrophospora sp. SA101]CAJ0842493.1 17247_t:CDS:2 [Entrophospora sp. SA101]CAJ0917799.1 1231_t:CDS:2 [Entrophospora sp. SA101]
MYAINYNNIHLFLLLTLFTTIINSLPHSDFRKRAPEFGAFTQCDGDFPIVVTEDIYTPSIIIPGENVVEHVVWYSTVEIGRETVSVLNVTLLDGTPIFTNEENYCEGDSKPPNIDCPIPAGHLHFTLEYVFPSSPTQPVNETIQYLVKSTLVSEGRTLLCVEGTYTVAYP